MQKITPHLWFDKEAREAAEFYTSTFPDSKVKSMATIHDTPSGTVDIVTIDLAAHEFTLFSAGPLFKFTPAVSFMVACGTRGEVDGLWSRLSRDGSVLMELGEYPFSPRYGWLEDRYGVSWQLIFAGDHAITQKITPTLLFTGEVCGKAERAIRGYTSTFRNTAVGDIVRYGAGEEPDQEGTVRHASFTLEGQMFAAMDSARNHNFKFNEAISFAVNCTTQAEIDDYWGKLSADPKAEQCGWVKDAYGLSWQIVPEAMGRMLESGDTERLGRVTQAMLQMKKLDVARLEEAYAGKPTLSN